MSGKVNFFLISIRNKPAANTKEFKTDKNEKPEVANPEYLLKIASPKTYLSCLADKSIKLYIQPVKLISITDKMIIDELIKHPITISLISTVISNLYN